MSEIHGPEAGEGDRQGSVPAEPLARLNEILVLQTLTLNQVRGHKRNKDLAADRTPQHIT